MLKIFIILSLLTLFSASFADQSTPNNINLILDLDSNFLNSFTGNNLYYLGTGIGLTCLCVFSDLDAKVLETTSKMNRKTTEKIGFPGIMAGYILPVSLPVGLYFSSKDEELKYASYAAGQAVIIAGVGNALIKSITGRQGPDPDAEDKKKASRNFRFGFMRGGIHYGWPSGHLMTNMAMVISLNTYFADKPYVKLAGYTYLTYLTTCVIIDEGGDVHWLSDIVTGALVGYAIGKTTGNYFKNAREEKQNSKTTSVLKNLKFSPAFDNNMQGIRFSFSF